MAGAKPSAPAVILVLGHSIGNGVGADNGTYGGAEIPAQVTFVDAGVEQSAWPDHDGTGPDPGLLPYLADHALAAGAGHVTVLRRSTNGRVLGGVQTVELPAAIGDQAALGGPDPDLVVLMIGENDAQNEAEAVAFAARLPVVADLIERRWPSARLVIQEMVSEGPTYSQFATIRAAQADVAAARSTRALASRAGIGLSDGVHYSEAGYAQAAGNVWEAWLVAQ